jgi:hypothetical protein
MTISKIRPSGHFRPHFGQTSGSRGAGGSVSFLMTMGPFHQSRQLGQGAAPRTCSSLFRRLWKPDLSPNTMSRSIPPTTRVWRGSAIEPFRVRQKGENLFVDSKIACRSGAETARLGQATVGSQPLGDDPGIFYLAFFGAVGSKQDVAPPPKPSGRLTQPYLRLPTFFLR